MTRRLKFGFEDLSARLLKVVPEIAERYEEELRFYGSEAFGQHIVFSDVFNPYIMGLLSSTGHSEKLARAFGLVEELAAHDDHQVREVAGDTVVETLIGKGLLGRAWPYMGEASRWLAFRKLTYHPGPEDESAKIDDEQYQRRWLEEIAELGGMENLTVEAVLSIRDRIYAEFGIKRYPRA